MNSIASPTSHRLKRPALALALVGTFSSMLYAQEFRPLGPAIRPPAVVASSATAHTNSAQAVVYTSEAHATAATADSTMRDALPVAYQTLDKDLWERIRRGFAMPELRNDWVINQEQWYASRPAYIGRMTERSSKYLYHIVEEIERRGMPTELALLPFVESAFNPKAVSSAKAAGMWQFIPSTGRDFALKQNTLRDDRRDVLASTKAALDYLQRLYGMFGDWHLALAAYNWGEGSVSRALAKNQRSELPGDYSSLSMPDETRNYVPKLQAIKNIVSNPAAFNAALPEIPNHPYFKSVPITRDMDVALAAKLSEMDIEDFKSLNPSANKPVIFSAGTPYILLPWDNVGIFERNLAIHNGQTAGWTVWTAPGVIKAGDAARRFGMSEEHFRQINNIPPRMLIKAGSTLLVPRAASHQAEVSEHVADNAQLSLQPEIVLVKQWVRLRKSEPVAALARRYKVSAAQLAGWNQVSPSGVFKAKQSVLLYVPQSSRAVAGRAAGKNGGKAVKLARGAKGAELGVKTKPVAVKRVVQAKKR